eukprot:2226551-Amphidinium_carterae.1
MYPLKVALRHHTAMHLSTFVDADPLSKWKAELTLPVLRPLMVSWVQSALKELKKQPGLWYRGWHAVLTHTHEEHYASYA